MIPVALSIAGSDSSCGAGIQADLKSFTSNGVHGLTAVTCVVAENPHRVASVTPIPAVALQEQIELLCAAYPIKAFKTGMLYSKTHIVAIVSEIEESYLSKVPLVVDPVMVASSGSPLIHKDALEAYEERLFPIASLITPNIPEAETLLGEKITSAAEMDMAAKLLGQKYGCDVLLKGGHLSGDQDRRDVLWHADSLQDFSSAWIDIPSTHGTGCSYSAAITAHLAKGEDMPQAVHNAKHWIQEAIEHSMHWEAPSGGDDTWNLNQAGIIQKLPPL